MSATRTELIDSFNHTLSVSKQLEYDTGSNVDIYYEGFRSTAPRGGHTAKIIVEGSTSFVAAKKYLSFGKTAVLNFANPVNPGGGVKNGAMAQEECLCRSSNLYPSLLASWCINNFYNYNKGLNSDFYSDRIIYSRDITVFKTDDEVPQLLPEDERFKLDIITCPAPYLGRRKYTNKAVLKEIFKSRIKRIFETAIENKAEVIILGAFGCGAFKNPPEVVAKAFHEVIDENNYIQCFEKIVFAIKSTVGEDPFFPCPNIMAFEEEFYVLSPEKNKLRFSDSYTFMQVLGKIEMPSGKVLCGDDIDNYLEWKKSNKYYGKQFSILGDSISTLEGYNPDGYNLFYAGENCKRSGVFEMKDTWWGNVIDFFGGELLVNDSWSGSRASRLPGKNVDFPSGCSDERIKNLHVGAVMPDVIMVRLGANDWGYGVEPDVFSDAYDTVLAKIKQNYPAAEIWCHNLSTSFMSCAPSFVFPYEFGGKHLDLYNAIIKEKAEKYGCRLLDIKRHKKSYDTVDGSHPTREGMLALAAMVIYEVAGQEGVGFFGDIESGCIYEYGNHGDYKNTIPHRPPTPPAPHCPLVPHSDFRKT